MRLAIFGATGRTGKPLLEQALNGGYEVVALARTPSNIGISHANLKVIQGDVMNPADVERTVQGTDAVISVLGHTQETPRTLLTVGMQRILAAMEKFGVKRLVSLTGAGVDDPHDKPKLVNHLIKTALKLMSGDVLKDSLRQCDEIRMSNLDWTIVRVPRLKDGAPIGKYRIGWVGVNTGTQIVRADVAVFLLKQVTENAYLRQAPMISN
jgi:putative NADH-flavin reductase